MADIDGLNFVSEAVRFNWVKPERLLNGWAVANPNAPVAFTKTVDNLLLLRGWLGGNTTTAPMFYLPEWARPAHEAYLPATAWPGGAIVPAVISTGPGGAVQLVAAISGLQWVSLDGLMVSLQPVF